MTALAIRCELLTGVYHAADPFGPPEWAEWPPHPYRLHAALVAAACEIGGERPRTEHVEALAWLERQGVPAITYGSAIMRSAPLAYVPRNPVAAEFARARSKDDKSGDFTSPWQRNGRRFPAAVPDSAVVTYQWPAVSDRPAGLDDLAHGVSWLGSARSPVACAMTDELPIATLVPAARGRSLRVAGPGLTDALLAGRHQWPTPVDPRLASYAQRDTPQEPDPLPAGAFGSLLVRRLERPRLDLRFAGLVCGALRAAVLSQAGDAAPPTLHGHGDVAHAAYLALADVDRPHATGLIAGLGLALPAGTDASISDACVTAFAQVETLALGRGMRSLMVVEDAGPASALRPERWAGPARTFATATPVILDRFPRRGRSVEDELRQSIVNAGFPSPKRIDVLAGPAVRGGVLISDLAGDVPSGMRVHASVEFDQLVRGPLVAGRGRFRGVGLFAPLR